MATQDRVPTGNGVYDEGNWTPNTGTDNYAVVDDPVGAPDDDTTYVQNIAAAAFNRITFTFAAFAITSSAIAKVTVKARCKSNNASGDEIRFYLVVSGAKAGGTAALTNSYGNYEADWLTNPATAAAWTEAEVEGTDPTNPLAEFGLRNQTIATYTMTQCYCTVTYTEATSSLPVFQSYYNNMRA